MVGFLFFINLEVNPCTRGSLVQGTGEETSSLVLNAGQCEETPLRRFRYITESAFRQLKCLYISETIEMYNFSNTY